MLLDHDSCRVNRAEWRCALQPLLPAKSPQSDYSLYAAKARKFFEAVAALPLSKRFALENPAGMERCDLVIVGSDEVWNLRHPWYGGYPLFFGEGLSTGRIASYAASFGNQAGTNRLDPCWADRLRRFPRISVRDAHSMRLIRDALGYEPEIVLDPCLQFPDTVGAKADLSQRPYVAIYGHTFPDWFRQEIRRWATQENYELVSIGYRNDWADRQWISAGPQEFAQFMADARAVATNFFHGCVFALLNNKPFACAPSDYRANKLRGLMEAVGAREHLVSDETPQAHYAGILGEAPQPAIAQRIAILRRRSNDYLDDVLG
jgi:hypothetical protein